jgi:hypothetical protein
VTDDPWVASDAAPAYGRLPSAGDVVAEFKSTLRGPDGRRQDKLMDLLVELHGTNLAQWDLEDVTRGRDVSDRAVASAKRDIDQLNLQRHRLVQEVDAAIGDLLTQTATATPSTETPAMVFDRLSVLVIRIDRTELIAKSSRPDAGVYAARLPTLQRQLDMLGSALDALLRDVRDGTRRFIPYEHLKLYAP